MLIDKVKFYARLRENYSRDYFGNEMRNLISECVQLLNSLEEGTFEYDTFASDTLLKNIRECANQISI